MVFQCCFQVNLRNATGKDNLNNKVTRSRFESLTCLLTVRILIDDPSGIQINFESILIKTGFGSGTEIGRLRDEMTNEFRFEKLC